MRRRSVGPMYLPTIASAPATDVGVEVSSIRRLSKLLDLPGKKEGPEDLIGDGSGGAYQQQ